MTEETEPNEAERAGERMLRDMDRWKERVEVSLDNRQVFFLFFGCALAACLVFVLGVMVGRRLEARAREQAVPVRSDPLAVLDQVEEEPEKPSTLKAAPAITPGPGPGPATKSLPKPEPVVEKKPEPVVEKKPEPVVEKKPEPDAENKPEPAASTAPSRYTLQLSAFQEQVEAEEFVKKLAGSGYKLNIVAADIPGRGVWYRVRMGDFSSQKAALDAKAEFEKKHHIIAYVMKL